MSFNKDLIPLTNAPGIVLTYQDVLKDVHLAFELLAKAKLRMKNTFGQYHDTIMGRIDDYDFSDIAMWETRVFAASKARIRREAWRFIVDKIQIRTLLSIKRQEELDRQLEEKNEQALPELTEENIFAFINQTLGNAPDLVEEALQEVFEILRPHKNYHDFKTNSEFEIGKKVFFNRWMDTQYTVRTNYYHDKDLNAINKLFHLMDGKPTPQYPNGLDTIINEACRQGKWEAETDYFRLQWFKKGSLHIEFKRLDLVAEINKRAGGRRLKDACNDISNEGRCSPNN